MFVYTFWEPRERMPFYLRLCMATWKKFLPNTKIIVLDYKNIGKFLDVRELGLNLFSDRRFNFLHISDAIRVALLAKYGGVWLDVDTIILNSNAEKYFLPDAKHRTIFFGNPNRRTARICFINTPPNSTCMNLWRESVKRKLLNLKPSTSVGWDFFGNTFIDGYAKIHTDEIEIINADIVMPEKKLISPKKSSEDAYTAYYFLQNHHLTDVNADMLLLHNSWTLPFFQQLSPQEFLKADCTMVNVLAEALDIELPAPKNRCRLVFEA